MKTRLLYIFSLLMLVFAAPATAQVVMISGTIEAETENEIEIFEYNKYIKVYTFVQLSDAREALNTLTANPKAIITYAYAQKTPEQFGDFKLEFDRTNDGAMLVWCSDKRYESRIIEKHSVRSGMKINLRFKDSEEKKEDNVKEIRIVKKNESSIDKDELEEKGVEIQSTRLFNKGTVATNEEEGGLMVSEATIRIPYKVKPNTRIVAQPVWYDRVDITDDASDTVFSYGKMVCYDRTEYGMTQSRLMDFNDMRDTLINYSQQIGDSRYFVLQDNEDGGVDTVKSQIYFSPDYDTIFVHLLDTLTGHDPNGAHPYPFGAMVAIGDYNRTLEVKTEKGGGERSDYMKFLDFKFKEFLPIASDFEEHMEDEKMEKAGELRLNFRVGKAEVEPGDTVNYKELQRLRNTFDEITNDPSGLRGLVSVDVHGMASPEGDIDYNKDLARRRAQYAINEIRRFTSRAVRMEEPEVAGWDKVADELRKDSLFDYAKEISDIVAANPTMGAQSAKIETLPYYESLIKDTYLPRLRTVRYKYIEKKFGQPEPEVVINRYKANKKAKLGRPEYWMLFNNITDKAELEEVAKYALEVTRNNYDADSIYGKGYWPYAAVLLACCYIGRDTVDLELLTPFLNTELDSANQVLKATRSYSTQVSGKRIAEYINFPEVAANQLIMVLNRRNSPMYRHVPAYEAMMKGMGEKYDTLVSVSKCLRGGYKKGNVSKTEEEAARVRQVVASTSITNSVIVNLAMAYSGGEKSKSYLEHAKDEMSYLPDNAKSDYLKSLIYFKDGDRQKSEQCLAYSFLKDLNMMTVANNDLDLVDTNTEYRVLPNAITIWKDTLSVLAEADGEKHPYTFYKKAIDELNKGDNADKEVAKNALYKCFDMDSRYRDVLNVSLKKDRAISSKKELVEILKELRNAYNRED